MFLGMARGAWSMEHGAKGRNYGAWKPRRGVAERKENVRQLADIFSEETDSVGT
jgi:hypothetical protein